MNKTLFIIALFVLGFTGYSQINNEHLNIDDEAPLISGIDQNGLEIDSKSILENEKILLIFYRGSWCPYCKKHLMSLQNHLDDISARGVKVIVVTPELAMKSKELTLKLEAKFPIIHDKNNKIMEAYKVAFKVNELNVPKYLKSTLQKVEEYNAEGNPVLPVPATYIIGQDNKIKYVQYDVNYSKRSDFKELLEIL